jgi:hypothetical protein
MQFRDPQFAQYQRLALSHLIPRLERERIGWATPALRLAAALLGRGAQRVGALGG